MKEIKLTYAQIRDPEFNPCVMKLLQAKMKYRGAKKVLKLAKAIAIEQKKSDAAWTLLAEKFLEAVKDDEGLTLGQKLREDLSEEAKKEAEDALYAFGQTEVVLEKDKLQPSDLAGVELTPADLARIEPLIDDEI